MKQRGLLCEFGENESLVSSVVEAMGRYVARVGCAPEVCLAATEWGLKESTVIQGVRVVVEASVPVRHLFVGSDVKGDLK